MDKLQSKHDCPNPTCSGDTFPISIETTGTFLDGFATTSKSTIQWTTITPLEAQEITCGCLSINSTWFKKKHEWSRLPEVEDNLYSQALTQHLIRITNLSQNGETYNCGHCQPSNQFTIVNLPPKYLGWDSCGHNGDGIPFVLSHTPSGLKNSTALWGVEMGRPRACCSLACLLRSVMKGGRVIGVKDALSGMAEHV
ncbi:hypothetical protein TREMEDRAFT_60752 [Tremella mesenterica DSM 1558]|uniref:uncharacterized protein n=1 Tax=Tremella mesenterica (strain ATCC 24925 / CBS 8224 / DSM 1558 / NBRC 9311 / NRRL Y-6157 / RJB 2259-6 / UBC 559-6) TaxID=578456 RepID=UPI0003F4A439|nr:uncharacterized protein TREMEDRAFT_60752 [Tremella mesenterica DSM 1558]EIW71832.1 hypothetical protein TREMEDRAFT_60752 [Tremella mesenterica DSM 1558]